MKKETFDFIWNNIIKQEANILLSNIESEDIQNYHIIFHDSEQDKNDILQIYNKIRNSLKKKYYNKGVNGRICHHKIASCLCLSLIKNKLFSFDYIYKSKKGRIVTDKNMLTINYKLAFLVSIGILFYYMIDFYSCQNTPISTFALDLLKSQKKLTFPKTSETHDNYEIGFIKMLALHDLYREQFDLLGLSTILYSLEEHNKQMINVAFLKHLLEQNSNLKENIIEVTRSN